MEQLVMTEESNRDKEQEFDFTYIFNIYYKRLYNFNYYRTHNQTIAEDLTSQVFEKAFTHIRSYDSAKAPFEVWLFTIARNTINDYFRSQKKYPWESLEQVFEMISNEPSPESKLLKDEEKDQLIKAVRKLNEKERTMIAYKYGAALKNKEIAYLTGIKEKTISVILCRALKKIKANMEKEVQ